MRQEILNLFIVSEIIYLKLYLDQFLKLTKL